MGHPPRHDGLNEEVSLATYPASNASPIRSLQETAEGGGERRVDSTAANSACLFFWSARSVDCAGRCPRRLCSGRKDTYGVKIRSLIT